MIVVIAVGYALGPPSVAGWGIVAAAALILPVLVQRFWRRPEPSMSESIRDNLRIGLARESDFAARFDAIEPIFPVFKTRLKQYAGTLSGGEQKMLLVARALMMRPSVILLDEITEGLQPSVIDRLAQALLWERKTHGTTMLVIEQNVAFALQVADRFMVLKQGEIVEQGNARDTTAAETVFAYLRV